MYSEKKKLFVFKQRYIFQKLHSRCVNIKYKNTVALMKRYKSNLHKPCFAEMNA